MKLAGVPDNATHHSLRRGAATLALSKGALPHEVQNRGRWRSPEGMKPYIKDSPALQGIRYVSVVSRTIFFLLTAILTSLE